MNKVGILACVVMLVVLGLSQAEPEPGKGYKGKGVSYVRRVYRPRAVYRPRPVYYKAKGKGFKSKGYKSKGYARPVYVAPKPVYQQPSYSSGYGHW